MFVLKDMNIIPHVCEGKISNIKESADKSLWRLFRSRGGFVSKANRNNWELIKKKNENTKLQSNLSIVF